MAYLKRFFFVLSAIVGGGMLLGMGVCLTVGWWLFPGRQPGDLAVLGLRGGAIFGGIWGLGIAIVSCVSLAASRRLAPR